MTIHNAIIAMLIIIAVGNLVGYLIRCIQEGFTFEMWVLALILFPVFFLSLILIPLMLPVFVFKAKEFADFRWIFKFLISIIAIPLGYISLIGNFAELSNETIWKALGDFKLKSSASTETQQVVSMRYVKITNNDLHRVYSDFRQTTNSVGNHVSRLVLLTR